MTWAITHAILKNTLKHPRSILDLKFYLSIYYSVLEDLIATESQRPFHPFWLFQIGMQMQIW